MLEVLTQLAAILIVSFFLKELADRINFPFIVLLVLGGTLLATYGIINVDILEPFPDMIRTLALIMVVFSSAFYLNVDSLKKHSKSILMLATIGVLLTTLVISTVTLYLLPIPFIAAAFLGVLLSGTDPAAISSSLPKEDNEVSGVIRAESLFNSPFTVILPLLLISYIQLPQEALLNIPKFFLLVIVGAFVGSFGGYIGRKLLENTKEEHSETLGLAIAIGTYVVAENFLGSGILAVALCSVLLNKGNYPKKTFLGEFNSELAFISTLFVFTLLGAQFTVTDLVFGRLEIFAIIIALLLARMFTALIVLFNSEFSLRDRLKIGLIAPKGVSPAALAPLVLVPELGVIGADIIVKITYVAVVASILVSMIIARVTVEEKTEKQAIEEQVEEKRKKREEKKARENPEAL